VARVSRSAARISESTNVGTNRPRIDYREIEMREALVLGGVAGLFAVVAATAVVRRRPR
jgi:hypothetical protein